MSRPRAIAWTAAAASAAVLVISLRALALHTQTYNTRGERPVFAFEIVDADSFTYAGLPVAFTPGAPDPDGTPTLDMTFGDRTLHLRNTIPGNDALPGLLPYENWLRVLRFVEATGITTAEAAERLEEGKDRLAVVTRSLNPGVDPRTWGSVWRNDWRFTFYELRPDGSIETSRRRFPESTRSLDRRQNAARRAGEPVPNRSPEDLTPEDWRYDAALQVMPPGAGPKMVFDPEALEGAGWAWPASVFSLLGMTVAMAFAIAPKRRRTA